MNSYTTRVKVATDAPASNLWQFKCETFWDVYWSGRPYVLYSSYSSLHKPNIVKLNHLSQAHFATLLLFHAENMPTCSSSYVFAWSSSMSAIFLLAIDKPHTANTVYTLSLIQASELLGLAGNKPVTGF